MLKIKMDTIRAVQQDKSAWCAHEAGIEAMPGLQV